MRAMPLTSFSSRSGHRVGAFLGHLGVTRGCIPLPLKHIYVLATGERLEIESLLPQEALLELIRHSYAARFGNHLLQATGMATHFKHCARLAQNTSVFRFRRPASLSVLDEHVSMLINDMSVRSHQAMVPHRGEDELETVRHT